MDFFNGFNWAVPKAFSDALAACQFEEGDTLYDTQKAYGDDWGEAEKHIQYHIQVREPTRGSIGSRQISGSIFNRNWNSDVFFELVNHRKSVTTEYIRTTQGRLYSALWHGDLSLLDKEQPHPELPIQLRVVKKNLKDTIPFAKDLAGSNPVFVMVRDLSNKISTIKHLTVKGTLHYKFGAVNHCFNVGKTGIRNSNQISPTIDIVFYVMEKGKHQDIHDALKTKLYTPAKNAKKDMFRLNTHGLLIAD